MEIPLSDYSFVFASWRQQHKNGRRLVGTRPSYLRCVVVLHQDIGVGVTAFLTDGEQEVQYIAGVDRTRKLV